MTTNRRFWLKQIGIGLVGIGTVDFKAYATSPNPKGILDEIENIDTSLFLRSNENPYGPSPFGPVPVEYEKMYKQFYDEDVIDIEQVQIDHNYTERFVPHLQFNPELFNATELKVLGAVVNTFKGKNTTEVVNISHKENAWIDNKDSRNIISYKKYAFDLKAFD